jgi:hypothetical protein
MKMNHEKFTEALTNSFEDSRVCAYAVAEALLREPVDLQERFLILFLNYLERIKLASLMPDHLLDLSNFAQVSWENYFEYIGISDTTQISKPGDLLGLLPEPTNSDEKWTNIKIEREYLPQNYTDENALWDKSSVLEFFRELSSKDLKELFDNQDFEFNEF